MLLSFYRQLRLISAGWIVLVALSPGLCAQTHSLPAQELNRKLSETMANIRDGKTSTSRTEAAERLATLTRRNLPRNVDDATLTQIVSLLDTQEDSVRAWVAAALGHLGTRAKVAVPRLLKLLSEVDCLRGSLTSAPFIRVALKRLGATVPPPPQCDWKAGSFSAKRNMQIVGREPRQK
jgi:hypothetical protein